MYKYTALLPHIATSNNIIKCVEFIHVCSEVMVLFLNLHHSYCS